MLAKGAEVLHEGRRAVLRAARHLLLWGGIPLIFVSLLAALRADRPAVVMAVELAALCACTATLWHDRERNVERGGIVLTVGLFVIAVCALVQFGPLMGTGAIWIGWALFAVFFVRRVALAIVGVATVCLAMLGWLALMGSPAGWPVLRDGPLGFVRVASTLLLLTAAVTYLFGRLVRALSLAVDHEHEALARERIARDEHEETERQLADAKRLEAVGELAGGAAHDFNNVLMVLAGGLDALKSADASEREALLAELDRTLEMARATTRQLLSFAKQGSNPNERALAHESITTLARALTRLLPEQIRVEHDARPTRRVMLSAGELEQLLLNLALNARDAMQGGGTLTIRCREESRGERAGVLVEVDDTGAGAASDTLARAGQPFFTTKPHGSGMGLSMVRRTLAEGRGELSLVPRDTGGTRAKVWLACAVDDREDAPQPAPAPRKPPPAAATTGTKVLLLEDEPDVRRVLTRILQKHGCVVTATADVAQALAALADGAGFEIVVTDASLPDGNASPVVRRARAAGLPVIVCSGHVAVNEVLYDIEHSDVSFLQKPCAPKTLVGLVTTLVREHRESHEAALQASES